MIQDCAKFGVFVHAEGSLQIYAQKQNASNERREREAWECEDIFFAGFGYAHVAARFDRRTLYDELKF